MHILVRRGLKKELNTYIPDEGEPVLCTDTRELFVSGRRLINPTSKRQCVILGPKNALGQPTLLEYSTPFTFKIKGGWTASLASKLDDYLVNVTQDTYITMAQNQVGFVYMDKDLSSGNITIGVSLDRPRYASSPATLENYVGKIPTMTSDTTPSGVASCSGQHGGGDYAYLAFDGNDGTRWWATTYVPTAWIQYRCATPILVKRMDMGIHNMSGFYTYASNDGATWVQLGLTTGFVNDSSSTRNCANPLYVYFHGNNTPFLYYRVQATGITGWSTLAEPTIFTLQFCTNEFPSTYFFNTTLMQMFDKTSNPILRVYLGEVTTGAAEITKLITYAYGGEFDTGWVPAAYSTLNTIQHNLGVDEYVVNSQIGTDLCRAPSTYFSAGRPGQTDWPYGIKVNMLDRNTLTAAVYDSDVPAYALQGIRLLCKRGW
jgi:hypothetical protein